MSKILFVGPMGAGKTTAIAAISSIEPIRTEAGNEDRAQSAKDTTTVAMDYGEIMLGNQEIVALYGAPGQDRFDFMWTILMRGALGAVLLLDHTRPDPLADLDRYLDSFATFAGRGNLVIGVGRLAPEAQARIHDYQAVARAHGRALPIFAVDVRRRDDVLLLVEALIATAELNAGHAAGGGAA
ncbi:GTP-binding protein [Derxia gummosa]|uniref:GTP-binding protein n=1 Tax=Derxia gummosa DSM 723 TaxID=1121388 RepID=A0A8B6X709_9BURK|nr:ATP/GTP-binding protein [Derxia gummosa]